MATVVVLAAAAAAAAVALKGVLALAASSPLMKMIIELAQVCVSVSERASERMIVCAFEFVRMPRFVVVVDDDAG